MGAVLLSCPTDNSRKRGIGKIKFAQGHKDGDMKREIPDFLLLDTGLSISSFRCLLLAQTVGLRPQAKGFAEPVAGRIKASQRRPHLILGNL